MDVTLLARQTDGSLRASIRAKAETRTLRFEEKGKPASFKNLRADERGEIAFTLPKAVTASLSPATR